MGVDIIPREEWGSWDSWSHSPRPPPADTVLTSYIKTNDCTTIAECREFMQVMQRDHVRIDKLEDVPYNFVVGGDGRVYEGRGWLLSPQLGYKGEEYTGTNLYIGIIRRAKENLDGNAPESEAMEELIKFGISYQLITQGFQRVHFPYFKVKANEDAIDNALYIARSTASHDVHSKI